MAYHRSVRTLLDGMLLHPDANAQLNTARSPDRSATEECALQEVILVEEIIDVKFGPNQQVIYAE